MIKRLKYWLQDRRGKMFVIANPTDNSVILSRALFNHIRRHHRADQTRAFVFRIPNQDVYAFTFSHDLDRQTTQLADIQYNAQRRCIGFETLTPTVARIFYDYGLPATGARYLRVKATIAPKPSLQPIYHYLLLPPNV